ncbi:hypothetical protein FPV67DRAFT_1677876 [Lyophyllum atratum]|nr:hypothetical protein FPV67DRAFT_1677876 [Lyophyllum atratum]
MHDGGGGQGIAVDHCYSRTPLAEVAGGKNATTTRPWASRSPSSHKAGCYTNQLCDRTDQIFRRTHIPTRWRVGGFLITPAEARRWSSRQEPDIPADDMLAIVVLAKFVRDNLTKFLVVTYPTQHDDDVKFIIPTRRARFSRQMFRDVDRDALRLEQFKWGEKEDVIHELLEEHGLEAEFATIYVKDSDWYKMV